MFYHHIIRSVSKAAYIDVGGLGQQFSTCVPQPQARTNIYLILR